ncbi:hypothetical protein [Allorhizocola rhizosphaerae]|uniref:hypothetical protein n=1 Tax=Allorhizocola rhizosphaerae TaxID=1872709 RepID=UPI000E3E616C|nr:hypothetical protein [Allorhizocola rhizosphaerae]
MKQTNPWRLVIGLLAAVALIAGVILEVSGERGTPAMPLLTAGLGLGFLWLVVSAICWEIRRR